MSPFADSFDDPRITHRFCRRVCSSRTDVTLVGVVHDHPASVARVRTILERVRPQILALELPSVAVPLYRAYADDGDPPRFGGEMSAAIAAAPDADVRGIDAPNWSFCRRLCARLLADRVSPTVARRVLSSLGGATRDALACRLAATLTHATSMTVACDDPITYNCTYEDSPAQQASHERAHVDGVRALLDGASDSESVLTYRDETRERCMIDRLHELQQAGPVVAAVGVDHLETLEAGLSVD